MIARYGDYIIDVNARDFTEGEKEYTEKTTREFLGSIALVARYGGIYAGMNKCKATDEVLTLIADELEKQLKNDEYDMIKDYPEPKHNELVLFAEWTFLLMLRDEDKGVEIKNLLKQMREGDKHRTKEKKQVQSDDKGE